MWESRPVGIGIGYALYVSHHNSRWTVCLVVGLALFVTGPVRADVRSAESLRPDALWTTSGLDEPADQPTWEADAGTGVPPTPLLTIEGGGLNGRYVPPATFEATSPRVEAVQPTKPPTRLFDSETSGLLMLHSLILFGLIHRRRKWAAALLAVVALSRSGLSIITDWVGVPKARAASTARLRQTPSVRDADLVLPTAPVQRSYAGLLRRLDGDPASAAQSVLVTQSSRQSATRLALRVAGFAVHPAPTTPAPCIPPDTSFAFLPSQGRALLPPETLAFALFARPPPPTA